MKSLRWYRFPLRRHAPVPQLDEASARRVMPALSESSNTNPHGHRPGREGSSFSGEKRWPSPTFGSVRRRAGVLSETILLGLILLGLTVLSGCFTGQRPSAGTDSFPPGSTSGDPAIDQVLARLDKVNDGPYTADYTVLTKFGNTTHPASVSVDKSRRSVTVGDVRFLTVDSASQTCLLDKTDPCSSTHRPGTDQRHPDHPRLLRHRRRQAVAAQRRLPNRDADRPAPKRSPVNRRRASTYR